MESQFGANCAFLVSATIQMGYADARHGNVRCGALRQFTGGEPNCSTPSSAAAPRSSLKDGALGLSVIMPIFIALPSEARARRGGTQLGKTKPSISERRRLFGILFGLDNQPAVVVHGRKFCEHPEEIDAAVARHGEHTVQNGVQKAGIARADPREQLKAAAARPPCCVISRICGS